MIAVGLPVLNELVALFVASLLIAYVCYRLRLVSIAGFLIAGVLIGPGALGLVHERELVDVLAEIGVILLLFAIGIEFSLERLSRIARAIFIGGSVQVAATIGAVAIILLLLGGNASTALYTGCLIALSSTAIVLGLLSDRDESDAPTGRLSLAILIFQDLAIVLMVLLVPMMAGSGESPTQIVWALVRAALLIAGVLLLARRVVPWILEHVAATKRQELFLLTVVAICFGTAAVSSYLGVSLALGAFLAGLVVSESRYSTQAFSEILPLKTLFNAVFFVSVGMLFDVRFLLDNLVLVMFVTIAVSGIKIVTATAGVLALGYPVRIAAATGLVLAQIGEFSFVLERVGRSSGLSPGGLGEAGVQVFIAATVLLMLLTPLQVSAARRFGDFADRYVPWFDRNARGEEPSPEAAALEDHVIVVGYGPAGKRLCHVLHERAIPFVVIELDPARENEMHTSEIPVIFGDASRTPILEAAGAERAKLCVLLMNEYEAISRVVLRVRELNPTLQVIVRTRYFADSERLREAGADIIVPEELETTVRIFSHVLGAYMIPPAEIERHVKALRSQDYGVLRGSIQEAHLMVLEGLDEDGMHTRAVAVREGTPAAGKTLAELALRQAHGLTVIAVRRMDRTRSNPSGDFRVEAGDRLVLIGTAERFAECAWLFRRED